MEFFRVPFEVHPSYFAEELVPFGGDPVSYVKELAEGKAASVARKFPKAFVVAADTIVFKDGKLFGKPKDEEEGRAMLREFNGSSMEVYSGVTVQVGEKVVSDHERTQVDFDRLDESELEKYHRAFFGKDIAGGYGIHLGGGYIVKQFVGCYYNVVGLPIRRLKLVLAKAGFDLCDYLG